MAIFNFLRPHSSCVTSRETLDGGFSRGWGFHFLPSEEGWIDIHNHFRAVETRNAANALIDQWFARMDAYRLTQSVLIIEGTEHFDMWEALSREDSRFAWAYWPEISEPRPGIVEQAAAKGAVALKLHNAPIMQGTVSRDVYASASWRRVFSFAQEARLPLLWHVTQRLSHSPYHGGGENAYWSEGNGKNKSLSNESLLRDMLRVLQDYPNLKVIGAHQLHIGLERLDTLFHEHGNLAIDSSCGFYLRWADDFIEEDRLILKGFLEKHTGRVLYGTDTMLSPGGVDDYLAQGNLCHARFLLRLGLSCDALQKIAWRNAVELLRLPEIHGARRGCVRP